MPDPLIALRLSASQWLEDDAFERLLAFLDGYPGVVDELIFFTAGTHVPLPLDAMARRCDRLKQILPRVTQRGYHAGINVLASMGHHEEDLPHSLNTDWPRVTDPQGQVSRGSYCPASPQLLEYVDQLYTLVAQTGYPLIWIDDDVRLLGHMPVRATCFCAECIVRFNQETGSSFTRDTLVAALRQSPLDESRPWRLRWLAHNRRTIAQLLRTAAEATHRVDPAIQLGFMTGDRFYEGYAFAEWAGAMRDPQSPPPRWRPGGGFYSDDSYMGLVDKAHAIGRQVSALPVAIHTIQSEIENFPYHRLRKSAAVTHLEAAAHMAAGATGLAFNILTQQPDPLDEYAAFLTQMATMRPFYMALRDSTRRGQTLGIWPAWNHDLYADRGVEGKWPDKSTNLEALQQPYVLSELGLPICYAQTGAAVTALAGSLPAAFTRPELERIFSGGVLMDAAALQTLARLGLGEWAGVQVAQDFEQDISEILSEHPLNGAYAGWSRDGRQSFWPQPAYRLEPIEPGVNVLSRLSDYALTDLGPGMTAFENALGGRVVVMGYYPWTLVHNLAKSSQLKAVCAWLSRDTLPAVVTTYARAVVWARAAVDGGMVLVVLNASLDPADALTLRIHSRASQARYLSARGQMVGLPTVGDDNDHCLVTLREVAPWSVHLLHVAAV